MGLELAKAWVRVRGDSSQLVTDLNRAKGPASRAAGSLAMSIRSAMTTALSLAGVAGVAGGLALATREAITFEKKMIDVRANARLLGKEGEEAFRKLERIARKLGETTQFTAVQAAEALDRLVLGGLTAEETVGAIPSVLHLAASANLELAQAAKIVVDNMRKFGMEAEDTGKIADYLSSAQSRAQITAADLAQGLQSLGSIASAMNVEFRDVVAILTGMGRSGTEMSRAGTSLALALARMSNQVDGTKEAMEELNLNMQDFVDAEGVVDLIGVFRHIADALPTNPIERAALAMKLFGARGREILGILNLMSAGTFVEDTAKGLEEDLGRAATVAAAKMDTFWGTIRKLRSAMGELFIAGLTPILKAIEPLVEKMKRATIVISSMWKWVIELSTAFAKTGIGRFLGDFWKLVYIGGALVGSLVGAGYAALFFGKALSFAIGMILSKYGLVVVALAAIGAAIVEAFGEGETFGEKMEDVLKNKIPAAMETAGFAFDNLADIIQLRGVQISQSAIDMIPGFSSVIEIIGAEFVGMFAGVEAYFKAWFDRITGGFTAIKDLIVAIGAGIQTTTVAIQAGNIFDLKSSFKTGFDAAMKGKGADEPGKIPEIAFLDAWSKARKDVLESFKTGGGLEGFLEDEKERLLQSIIGREEEKEKERKKPEGGRPESYPTGKEIEAAVEGGGRVGFRQFGLDIQDALLQKADPQLQEMKDQNQHLIDIKAEVKKGNKPQEMVLSERD